MSNNFINIRLGESKKNDSQIVEQSLIETTANIVGTAYKGPAFVPQKIFSEDFVGGVEVYNTLGNVLGTQRQNQHAHLYDNYSCYTESEAYDASLVWLSNGGQYLSFTRVLGIGTGNKDPNTGKMSGSGFNVSKNISSGTLTQKIGDNLNAITNGVKGNVTFVLKTLNEVGRNSAAETTNVDHETINYIDELGYNTTDNDPNTPNITLNTNFITDVFMFPSGTLPNLISSLPQRNSLREYDVNPSEYNSQLTKQQSGDLHFIQILGYSPKQTRNVNDDNYNTPAKITSLSSINTNEIYKRNNYSDPANNYFENRILEKGHLTYTAFTFNGLGKETNNSHRTTILTAKPYEDINNQTVPDYNSFESEFTTAKTPWITSQPYNTNSFESGDSDNRRLIHKNVYKLFRFYSLDDGEVGNKFRIKINPKKRGGVDVALSDNVNKFATFDLYIFQYEPRINKYQQLEYYRNLDLNPNSKNYIGRQIGTKHTYYDFNANQIVERGIYENKSQFLRVEISEDIEYNTIHNQYELIPSGFKSYPYIDLKKDAFSALYGNDSANLFDTQKVKQLPPMYSLNFYEDYITNSENNIFNNWGVVFTSSKLNKEVIDGTTFYYLEPKFTSDELDDNDVLFKKLTISPHFYHTKYFLSGIENTNYQHKNVWKESENYLNSFFHLEKIAIKTDANGNYNLNYDKDNPRNLLYKHSGRPFTSNSNYTYLKLNSDILWEEDRTLKAQFKDKLSFDFFTYGGFDGVDIRDSDKRFLKNDAIQRELYDTNETKSTYAAYDKAIDISMNEANCAGDIFVMPGINEISLLEKVTQKCEEDRRHFFIANISGAASNRLVNFNKIVIDPVTEIISDGELVKTSLGTMGNQCFIEDNISNYRLDESKILTNDKRYYLGINSEGDDVYCSYQDVLEKQHSHTILTWKNLNVKSRYLFPTFGNLVMQSLDLQDFKKQVSPETFVLGQIAQTIIPRNSLINVGPPLFSLEFPDSNISIIDDKNLNERDIDFESITKDLRSSSTNLIYISKETDELKLLSENTAYTNRKSVFQKQNIVRTLQEIKKIIKYNIFINDDIIEGGFLFSQNSNLSNLYSRLQIQLDFLIQNFVTAGYITDYIVRIPNAQDDQALLDMQNYIVRGSIVLQFNQSDIIELSIDNILNDLSLLSNNSQDDVLIQKF